MSSTEQSPSLAATRVAVVGAGGWGANLVRNLAELGALAAVVDPSPERCEAARQAHPGIEAYAELDSALRADIQAVVIATPVPTHFPIAKAALEAGKDVFVEKPLTLDASEAEALQALAGERERVFMVGQLVLFQPAIGWIRDYLRSGALGEVRALHQERLGLGRVRERENVLWCLGSHDIAVQLFLLDTLPHALRVNGQCAHQPGIEDDAYLHLNYPGGIETHLHASWWWPERRRRLTVQGTLGMLIYDELEQTVTLHRKTVEPDLSVKDDGEEPLFSGHTQPLRLEMEHFLECVRLRRRLPGDNQYGVDVVRILAAAERQLRQGADGAATSLQLTTGDVS